MKKRNLIAAILCSACLVAGSVNPVFADANKVPAPVTHQPQNVVLRRVNGFSATCRPFHHDIAFLASVNFLEAWICFDADVHSSSSP